MPEDTYEDLPSTIKRSDKHAQEIFLDTLNSANKTYGEGGAAPHRVAYAALKNEYQKVGDHWEPKGHKGPSDKRATEPTPKAIAGKGETFGGIDYYGETKEQLANRLKKYGKYDTTKMTKQQVAHKLETKLKELDTEERRFK